MQCTLFAKLNISSIWPDVGVVSLHLAPRQALMLLPAQIQYLLRRARFKASFAQYHNVCSTHSLVGSFEGCLCTASLGSRCSSAIRIWNVLTLASFSGYYSHFPDEILVQPEKYLRLSVKGQSWEGLHFNRVSQKRWVTDISLTGFAKTWKPKGIKTSCCFVHS